MKIVFPLKNNRILNISFGWRTSLWQSMYWLTVIEEQYGEYGGIEYATMKFCFFKHPKFWEQAKNNY